MRGDQRVLAVVPARGGSKGVPRKNLAEVGGMSLVRRAVGDALDIHWIDEVVLSTDDAEIAEEGRLAGLENPLLRPPDLATDLASGFAVWRHALTEAEARSQSVFDLSVLIQPTSPFRHPDDITACVDLIIKGGYEAVTTVSPTPSHYAPEKTMVLHETGRIEPFLSSERFESNRQRIPTYYHLNGICYAALRSVVLERDHVFGDNTGAVVVERPTVNIDDPLDLEIARWLWARQ